MEFRCVKCGESHTPGECKIKESDGRDALSCILCKQKGHPASYRSCPVYKEIEKKKEEKKIALHDKIRNRYEMFNNYSNKNFSYANALKNNNKKNSFNDSNVNNNNTNYTNNSNSILENLNNNMLLILQKINTVESKINKNTNDIKYLYEMFNYPNNC